MPEAARAATQATDTEWHRDGRSLGERRWGLGGVTGRALEVRGSASGGPALVAAAPDSGCERLGRWQQGPAGSPGACRCQRPGGKAAGAHTAQQPGAQRAVGGSGPLSDASRNLGPDRPARGRGKVGSSWDRNVPGDSRPLVSGPRAIIDQSPSCCATRILASASGSRTVRACGRTRRACESIMRRIRAQELLSPPHSSHASGSAPAASEGHCCIHLRIPGSR